MVSQPRVRPLRWKEPRHESFVWHGTLEAGMLREFLSDVIWGELDVLLVDLPPGTERLNALREFVPELGGAIVVTLPSDASKRAVERAGGASLALHLDDGGDRAPAVAAPLGGPGIRPLAHGG